MDGCDKQPTYNMRGECKGRFCAEHKEPNMVDVKNKTCEMDGCDKQPTYNMRGECKGRFCAEHKEPNMVDVISKTCEMDACTKRVLYGSLGKAKRHCGEHRQPGMITSPNQKCESVCCNELGTHEAHGKRYCDVHMPAGSKNLGIEKCLKCNLNDILTNGICNTCDPQVFQIRGHAKENRVKDLYTAAGFTFVHDKMLEGSSCGRERPDFQFECGTHFVYVEVDENQHQSYACECEQTRMINLVHVRGMPVRWIRYNPDTYKAIQGQRKMPLEQREKKLLEYTKWALKHPPETISNVLYLFYDNYDALSEECHVLM